MVQFVALLLEAVRHARIAGFRMLQVLLIDEAHEHEVFRRLRDRLVVQARTGERLPADTAVEVSRRGFRTRPSFDALKAAGSALFLKPLQVHLQPTDFFVKGSRQFLLTLRLLHLRG